MLLRVGDRQLVNGDAAGARASYLRADVLCAAAAAGRTHWARWRIARLDRIAGQDASATLELAWADLRPYARRWLPDALSLLVEAAAAAEATGNPARAGVLAATVAARRGSFLLRLPVEADLARLSAQLTAVPLEGLPADLFGAAVTSS
ncbi:MAG: hypothetical protein QOJ92_2124 [Frankiales bacterium]|nr:hypothetical protein [Frankiales bacterium]